MRVWCKNYITIQHLLKKWKDNKNNFCQHSRSDQNLHFYYLYLYSNTVASTTRTHSVALVVTLRVGYYHLVYLSTYIS